SSSRVALPALPAWRCCAPAVAPATASATSERRATWPMACRISCMVGLESSGSERELLRQECLEIAGELTRPLPVRRMACLRVHLHLCCRQHRDELFLRR